MLLNNIEKEVIFLKSIKDFVDEMVNSEIMILLGDELNSEIRFNSITHQKFFNIILLDFLSCSDKNILGEKLSYLWALEKICENPNFNEDNSINNLDISTKEFIEWLEKEVIIEKIWLPSINLELDLSIKRIEFIKICGNISKHNFTRLSGVLNDLIKIFLKNKFTISEEEALLILNEFYELFHDSILEYHSSIIAEFLNNIRWGIYEYLQDKYKKSIPKEIKNIFAKKCYYELMSYIRLKPHMKKFQVTKNLKMRY